MQRATRTLLLTKRLAGGGISYLFRDLYTTDRAAGAVNSTAAEPGPGTRTVADTGSNISITGGQVAVASATTVLGQTALHYATALTRRVGQVVAGDIITPSGGATTVIAYGGLSIAAPSLNSDNVAWQLVNGVWSARRTSSGNSPALMAAATGTTYRPYQVLRLTGRFFFIKAGGVTKLMWMDEWDNTASLYVDPFTIQTQNTGTPIYFDNLIAPNSLVYDVQALASDSFNRADGVLGSTDGAGHLEANSGSGKAWTAQVGTWAVASNKAACSALSGGVGIATVDAGNADVVMRFDITRAGDNVGFVLRYVDSSNYIYGYYEGTNVTLRKVVAGVDSQVLAPTAVSGTKIMVYADGTKFRVYFDELHRGAEQTISDAALQSSTVHGLYTSNIGNTFDNVVIFKRNGWDDLGAY